MFLRTAALAFAAMTAPAAVTHIYLVERSDIPGYNYERVVAKAYFEADPKLPANRIIRDIDRAPLNANGKVEYSADICVLKPRNPVEGNGTLLFEVSNRGRKGLLGQFNFASASLDPKTQADMGDGFLLKQGYTLVWVGWQADAPMEANLLRLFAPIATLNGKTITGPVRSEWIVDRKTNVYSLGDRGTHVPYPASNPNDPKMVLTVRDQAYSAKTVIPRSHWQLGREEFGKVVSDTGHVYMAAGFEPGKIYEIVYEAQDPTITGLGPAAIRDLISFLRYENNGVVLLGEQSRHLKRAVAFGTSQSGRFLRTFLYFGFNADEKGRKVFDGVWSHVAGAGRGSFNHRFAQPSRDGHPFLNILYPTDLFPFTDLPETDAETGMKEGLLDKTIAAKMTPKIFYTNGSYEYWGRAASLIHTTPDGSGDFATAPDTRIYFLTGTQHGSGSFPPGKNNTQHLANPNDYRFVMRALLDGMQGWLKENKEPPASSYPLVAKGQLTKSTALAFPALKGVAAPKRIQQAWRADYGPEFRSHGIVTNEPPKLGKAFVTLVPQIDKDGNEISGIRLPELQVPLATYAGWNLRSASIGGATEFHNMTGSFFPFSKTKADRAKSGDPRPSIEERYSNRDEYLKKIGDAARALAKDRYLRTGDIPDLEQRASRMWDTLR